jgi:hypothetical protein
VSSAGRQDTYEKIIVRIAIRGQDKITHTTTAMIDCGATENFIDREYARQNQIPLLRKAVPRHCLAVDGTEVLGGPITHEALLDVTINNHEETVRLQCITIGNSSVILGLPWLRKHNPAIDSAGERTALASTRNTAPRNAWIPHRMLSPSPRTKRHRNTSKRPRWTGNLDCWEERLEARPPAAE